MSSKLDDLGSWFGPTSLELSVPSYMKGVDSLADLKGKAGTFGGKITGIESSAGMMGLLKRKVLKGTGLDKEYKVVDSSTPAMLAELKRAYAKKEPIVVTLWSPHWAYSDYDLKKLKDPKGASGKGDGVASLSRKGFAQDNPVVGQWLKNFRMRRSSSPVSRPDQQGGQGQAAGRGARLAEAEPRSRVDSCAGQELRGRCRDEAPGRGLVPLGRGRRRQLPLEERPGAARLHAEPQADGRRPRLHRPRLR